jgi:hypothetical protein
MHHQLEMLVTAVKSRQPVIWIVADDERAVMEFLQTRANGGKYRYYVWTRRTGMCPLLDYLKEGVNIVSPSGKASVSAALQHFHSYKTACAMVVPDGHLRINRRFDDCLRDLKDFSHNNMLTGKSVIVISPSKDVPSEIAVLTTVVNFPRPGVDDLASAVRKGIGKGKVTKKDKRLAHACRGLSLTETTLIVKHLAAAGKLDVSELASRKAAKITATSPLNWIPAGDVTLKDVGGLERLKAWIETRTAGFNPENGLPQPRGLLLCGPPGVGKSLVAKAVASTWGLPLLQFDVGSVFGPLVGDSERNTRQALDIIDAASPCVVWIEEMEKILSGVRSSERSDGGTTARVVSYFLTWMQERESTAVIVGTVNGIEEIRPELIRRRRWDEIFWLDLPNKAERGAIWDVLASKYGARSWTLKDMVNKTHGFTGAEMEQALVNALYRCHASGSEVTDEEVLNEVEAITPQSQSLRLDWYKMRSRFTRASKGKPIKVEKRDPFEEAAAEFYQ